MKRFLLSKSLLVLLTGILFAWIGCVRAQRHEALPTSPEPVQEGPRKSAAQREELPADLKCPIDHHPTLWEGKVTSFKRGKEQTEIAVRADWDTDYSGVLS